MVENLFSIVGSCAALLYALVMTFVVIVKHVRSKGVSVTSTEEILELLPQVWCNAEEKFKNTFGTNVKSGVFKLDYALGIIRDMCDERKMKFDRSYWTDALENLTKISNTQKDKEVQQVDSNKVVCEVSK